MSDRDEVRALAEEIVRFFIPPRVEHQAIDPELAVRAETSHVKRELDRFLDKREAELRRSLEVDALELVEIGAQLHRALGEGAGLRGALIKARPAIESLDDDALGTGSVAVTTPDGESGEMRWPLRDELVDTINRALASSPLSERAGAVLGAAMNECEIRHQYEAAFERDGMAFVRGEEWATDLLQAVSRSAHDRREAVDALRDELGKGGEGEG